MNHILHFGVSEYGQSKGYTYVWCLVCRVVVWAGDIPDATRTIGSITCEPRERMKSVCILCRRTVEEGQHNHLDGSGD